LSQSPFYVECMTQQNNPDEKYNRYLYGCPWEVRPTEELFYRVAGGELPVVEELLEKGAAVNGVDREGITPLMLAIYHGEREIAEMLIAHGAEVNAEWLDQLAAAKN
jgi:Ankyrin repeats (3 copies)